MSDGTSAAGPGPWWVVVTGASQGLGAAICTCLAPLLPPGSKLLGMARSQQGLDSTVASVKAINPEVTVVPVVIDLSTATAPDFEAVLEDHLAAEQSTPPAQALVFHNAGSLGALKYLREMDDASHISNYFNLNIGSVILLNAAFLRLTSAVPSCVVKMINISSICGLEPFKSWGLYCTGKAGRNMLFKVLAAENPSVRVLSYGPGPLNTDMQVHARTETQDDDLRKAYTSMKEDGKLLSCDASVKKLLQVLEKDEFKSGDYVDIYDV